MSPEERGLRAVAVRQLLADQSVKDAFLSIERDLTDEWKATHSPEERENLWRAVNVMERLKTWLQTSASGDLTALKRTK